MEVRTRDIPTMFSEMMVKMKMEGRKEQSRNGQVLTIPEPVTVAVTNPLHRTLFDPVRDANPFFHVMEFVWMMSGSNRPDWIGQFNKRFHEYADNNDNNMGKPKIHGAYGHRWRKHFPQDQIQCAIKMLKKDPTSRRVVISMWDANVDLMAEHNDLPCNTHIYFRVVNGVLDMTVANRSNDIVWGMTGANAVHMTMLHELIAKAIQHPIGTYRVFTVNAHLYEPHWKMLDTCMVPHLATTEGRWGFHPPVPLIAEGESYNDFMDECGDMVRGGGFKNNWLKNTALPIRNAYLERKQGKDYGYLIDAIEDKNWQAACQQWIDRRDK